MKIVFELPELKIKVEQNNSGFFRVTYGKQVKGARPLSYEQATKVFGSCVFHALACEGLVNNEGP